MSREKQIDEIAKDLSALDALQYNPNYTANYQRAVGLHSLGYRKASEVAREIIDRIDEWFMYCEKYSGHIIKSRLAELKKKYTEGEG